MSDHKIRVLVVLPAIIPSTKIGIINPLKGLQDKNEVDCRVLLESQVSRLWSTSGKLRTLLSKYDVLVMCRNQSSVGLKLALEARRQWVPLIYDIDDNFFDISLASAMGRNHRHPAHLYQLEEIIAHSSLVRVYSRPMADHMRRLSANHEIVDSYFDNGLVKRQRRERHRGTIRIAYPTSRVNDELAEIFVDAMHVLLKKYDNKIELHLWSNVPGPLRGFDNVIKHKPVHDYEKFIRAFYKLGFDIGLAPLRDSIFHRSKTNNKYREYSGCGVAGVYSAIDVYTDCVQHRKNGMIAENTPESWTECIEALIEDRGLRASIAEAGALSIANRYSFESNLSTWRQQLTQVTNDPYRLRKAQKPPARPLSVVALCASDESSSNRDLTVWLNKTSNDRPDSDQTLGRDEASKIYLGRQERRINEYSFVTTALGAVFSRAEFSAKGLANISVNGILVVVATTTAMVKAALELRNSALAMVIDSTSVVDPTETAELVSRMGEWRELAPNIVFVFSEQFSDKIGTAENIKFVKDEWVESADDYFSHKGRLYTCASILDDIARNLSTIPESDRSPVVELSKRFGARMVNRWRSLRLLVHEILSD